VSGHANGLDIDLAAALDPDAEGDAGVPGGAELLAFATAVQTRADDVAACRDGLEATVGTDGLHEAAATIAIFNGLVRVADGTGIQLDEGVLAASADYRGDLGLNSFGGAVNTLADGDVTPVPEITSIHDLFA